jgi:hypothetical protein
MATDLADRIQTPERKIQIGVRLSEEEHRRLAQIAHAQNRRMTETIRHLIHTTTDDGGKAG